MKLILIHEITGELEVVETGDPIPMDSNGEINHWDAVDSFTAYHRGRQDKANEILESLTREFFKEGK